MKRIRDNNEDRNDMEHLSKYPRALDPHVQCFAVPELIENIVKHLVKCARTVLRISQVSKLHFNVINDKAMWIRFGFPAQHFSRTELPAKILYDLLKLFYIDKQRIKQRKAKQAIQRIYELDRERNFFKVFNETVTEERDLITNNYITEEAALALLNIMRGMQYCPFSLSSLIRWLEQDPSPSKCKEEVEVNKIFHSQKVVDTWERYECTVYQYLMEDPKKRLIFIFTCKKHFVIKVDISKNLIEICGHLQLLTEKKFNNECVNTFNYLCEVDRSESDWNFLISNYRSLWSPVDNAGPFIYKAYPTSFFENITFVHPFKVRPY